MGHHALSDKEFSSRASVSEQTLGSKKDGVSVNTIRYFSWQRMSGEQNFLPKSQAIRQQQVSIWPLFFTCLLYLCQGIITVQSIYPVKICFMKQRKYICVRIRGKYQENLFRFYADNIHLTIQKTIVLYRKSYFCLYYSLMFNFKLQTSNNPCFKLQNFTTN